MKPATAVRDKFYEMAGIGIDSEAVRNFFSGEEISEADTAKLKATLQFADKGAKIHATINGELARTLAAAKMVGLTGDELREVLGQATGITAAKRLASGEAAQGGAGRKSKG